MPHARYVVDGTDFVIGIKEDRDVSFSQQRKTITALSGAELLAAAKTAPNFAMVLRTGELGLFPVGYIYASFAAETTLSIRWSFRPSKVDDVDIHKTVTRFMESNPALQETPYKAWEEYIRA